MIQRIAAIAAIALAVTPVSAAEDHNSTRSNLSQKVEIDVPFDYEFSLTIKGDAELNRAVLEEVLERVFTEIRKDVLAGRK